MKPALENLPETITAPRTDAIYNCHGYLTKVPIGAIEPFIEAFTKKGEVIADFFAGSGMTGLAAVRVGRKARLSDISALGQHIATGYSTRISPERFRKTADEVVAKATKAIGDLYLTRRTSDQRQERHGPHGLVLYLYLPCLAISHIGLLPALLRQWCSPQNLSFMQGAFCTQAVGTRRGCACPGRHAQ